MYIVGAGCISALGTWRGLARRLHTAPARWASAQLAASHPGAMGFDIGELPESSDVSERRARLQMSRPAILAAIATRQALADSGFAPPHEDVGFFMGVGASAGSMAQLTTMLRESVDAGVFSVQRFGSHGLSACNPLYAFQLMNNFTMAHSAILHGIGGPNAAFFSRGAGTVTALGEAAQAIRAGDCARALAGGADSAFHPVTYAELVREGAIDRGLVPGEGAALFALSASGAGALARLERSLVLDIFDATREETCDAVVVAPCGSKARAALLAHVKTLCPKASVFDVTAALGESLAATPALANAVALDLIASEGCLRVTALCAGPDGALGVITLSRP